MIYSLRPALTKSKSGRGKPLSTCQDHFLWQPRHLLGWTADPGHRQSRRPLLPQYHPSGSDHHCQPSTPAAPDAQLQHTRRPNWPACARHHVTNSDFFRHNAGKKSAAVGTALLSLTGLACRGVLCRRRPPLSRDQR